MSTQYYPIKAQVMAIGRPSLSAANRDSSPLEYSEQPPFVSFGWTCPWSRACTREALFTLCLVRALSLCLTEVSVNI